MAKILFRLNGVSDDETNDVRELLTNNAIDFYETSSGNWGVSMPAIWLSEDSQFEKAQALLNTYQNERTIRMREEYARLKREGKIKPSRIQLRRILCVLLSIWHLRCWSFICLSRWSLILQNNRTRIVLRLSIYIECGMIVAQTQKYHFQEGENMKFT